MRGIDCTGVETPLALREPGWDASFVNMRVNLALTVAFSGGGFRSEVPLAGVSPLTVGLPSPLVPAAAFVESDCEELDLMDDGFELAAEDGLEVCCGMTDVRQRGLREGDLLEGRLLFVLSTGPPLVCDGVKGLLLMRLFDVLVAPRLSSSRTGSLLSRRRVATLWWGSSRQ